MEKELKASVQYGDFIGEIMCDGFDGPFLHEIWEEARLPDEYFPIALSFEVVERLGKSSFLEELKIAIYACDKFEYGDSIDKIEKAALEKGSKVIVKKFELNKNILPKIFEKIKRSSVIIKTNYLNDKIKICVTEDL